MLPFIRLFSSCFAGLAIAAGRTRRTIRSALSSPSSAAGGYDATEQAVAAIAATGDGRFVTVLEALGAGDLYARKSDGRRRSSA